MYKLTFEAVKTAFEATGGTIDKTTNTRNGYLVTFAGNDKAYTYAKSLNLFQLASKLHVFAEVVSLLDTVNFYNEGMIQQLAIEEQRLAKAEATVPGTVDENDFFSVPETEESIKHNINNIKFEIECLKAKLAKFNYMEA